MTEQDWQPHFRAPRATVTKVMHCPAFLHARERASSIIEDADELRALADLVETLDHANPPLSIVADRVGAAVRLLLAIADRLDGGPEAPLGPDAVPHQAATQAASAGIAARQRLVVAGLHYLITPDDLVPDFRVGGYVDDVLALTWIFGAAVNELAPYLDDVDALEIT